MSLIQYDEDPFQIYWTAAGYGELSSGFNQSETGKYFESIKITGELSHVIFRGEKITIVMVA